MAISRLKFLTLEKDLEFIKPNGYSKVIGIDEVGRGSWAGPVAVGAYVLESSTQFIEGVNDSKLVKPAVREKLSETLVLHSHSIHLGNLQSINDYGIGQTIVNLIYEIIQKYNSESTLFLIDGQFSQDFGKNTLKVIKGDSIYYSIAAASIIAKVYRDNLMKKLSIQYPGYGFETNVGYPTRIHIEALKVFGPNNLHRTSFKPISRSLH